MGNIRRGVGVLNSKSRIFLYHLSDELPPLIRSFVDSLQEEDPLAPVTVVVPSWYAGFSLRHELGRSGLANVRFITSYRLSDLLGAPSRDRQKRRPLTPIIENASIRAVLEDVPGRLMAVRTHPSTQQSLRWTFRQLRRASDAAVDRLGRRGSLTGEVVDLYRRFQARTCEFYHDEELAEAAAEAVRNDPSLGLENVGFTVFFQARDLTSGERKLIEALAGAGRCAVFLGLTGEEETDAPIKRLAGDLRSCLGEPQREDPVQESRDTQLVVAPDPHQEIRWVIRHMMRQAESGTPFHRMAVLYRKREPYGTLIRSELEAARIPVAGLNPGTLGDTAVGRTLNGLMELRDGELKRDSVMSWLTSCPVKPADAYAGAFSPSRWDTVSKEAGIVRGLDQWRQRLKSFSDRQERSAKDLEEQGEISEGRAKAKRSEAAAGTRPDDVCRASRERADASTQWQPLGRFLLLGGQSPRQLPCTGGRYPRTGAAISSQDQGGPVRSKGGRVDHAGGDTRRLSTGAETSPSAAAGTSRENWTGSIRRADSLRYRYALRPGVPSWDDRGGCSASNQGRSADP